MSNRKKKRNLSSATYGILNTPKSGTDGYGRVIANDVLYKHTSQIVGTSEEMVEHIIMFVGQYVAASLESNLNLDVMVPGFGKFRMDTKKKFKKEKKMMEYSTVRQVNKDAKLRIQAMLASGDAVIRDTKNVTTIKKTPVLIGPYIHTIQGLKFYRMEALTRDDLFRIFGKDEEIWTQMEIEMKKIDDYKLKKK